MNDTNEHNLNSTIITMNITASPALAKTGIDGNRARNAEERMMMEDIGKWNRTGIYEGTADERTGATPLHVAAVKGYQEIMK